MKKGLITKGEKEWEGNFKKWEGNFKKWEGNFKKWDENQRSGKEIPEISKKSGIQKN
jgi:hypothetical protein